ncbi:uncharacterized protein [Oryza sativa Japonica Group]|uniref:uncharacterized protein isoform X6 n=1 Tax=Oryza sativa subsp. japonica TaxID=39947 RepID=UPI00339BA1F2
MVDLAVRFSGQTLAGRPRSPPPTRRRLASPLLPGAASSSASPRRLHLLRRHCVVPVPGCLRLRLPLAQGAAVSASSTAVAVNVAEHRLRRPRSATVPPCRTKSRCICLFLPLALPPRPPRCAVAVAEQGLQGGRGESEEEKYQELRLADGSLGVMPACRFSILLECKGVRARLHWTRRCNYEPGE